MITGNVNSRVQALVPVILADSSGQTVAIVAVIDPGLTGDLTLRLS